MSYPSPGPYPAPPQEHTGAVRRTPPRTVQRAFVLMLVSAGLTALNVVFSFAFEGQVQQKIDAAVNSGAVQPSHSVNLASTASGGIVGVGLWIWMAYANRAGHSWARITGTVFFGISCLSVVFGLIVAAVVSQWLGAVAAISALLSVGEWVLGLLTVILLWNKRSSEYFNPPPAYPAPYGYPGGPMPPYPYPVMPQQQNGAPQQPTDPWATPNG